MRNNNKGITLIVLVVTIIVILIVAGISIATLVGNNGILNHATIVKEIKEKQEIKEKVNLAVTSALLDGIENDEVNSNTLKKELEKDFGTDNIEVLTAAKNHYVIINEKEKYMIDTNGNVTSTNLTFSSVTSPKEENSTNCTGCYVSIDGDDIPDGIIYADLGKGCSGKSGLDTNYEVNAIEEDNILKSYIISSETVEGSMGLRRLIKLDDNSLGTEKRFYIMGLNDIKDVNGNGTLSWYKNATGNMTDYGRVTKYG